MRTQNNQKITISVIIPTLNEAKNISRLVQHLFDYQDPTLAEIIVVDGGSEDNTIELAQRAGAKVIKGDRCGRAYQMNRGVQNANGTVLYFVHCDTTPPPTYLQDIRSAIQAKFSIGCFQTTFDTDRPLVKTNSIWSRFDFLFCRGGDQSLFVSKALFEEIKGYKEELLIMEEYDFLIRARKKYQFKIIPSKIRVSARKYENRSYFKVQFANIVVFNMFRFGASQERIVRTYKQLLG